MAYSDESWFHYQFSILHFMRFSLKVERTYVLNLGIKGFTRWALDKHETLHQIFHSHWVSRHRHEKIAMIRNSVQVRTIQNLEGNSAAMHQHYGREWEEACRLDFVLYRLPEQFQGARSNFVPPGKTHLELGLPVMRPKYPHISSQSVHWCPLSTSSRTNEFSSLKSPNHICYTILLVSNVRIYHVATSK